jgi:hypothetical protein
MIDWNLYKKCQGCFKVEKNSKINWVKPYMDGDFLMDSQWLCDVCLNKFMESFIEYRRT